jgi:hypothetical protein
MVTFPTGTKTFPHSAQTGYGAHPASHPIGKEALSRVLKGMEHNVNHSPYLVPRLSLCGTLTPLPPCVPMVRCLILHL